VNPTEEADLDYALRGKAWKVYWFLLKSGHPISVREVQRELKFSSPSVAHHHLEQLCNLGLAKKEDVGNYYVLASEVKIGVLRHYVRLGKLLFPRYFFYALFTTSFYIIFLLFYVQRFSRENLFLAFFSAIVCGIFWYEAYRFWSLRPY
jgi:predicted DNA-binding transcriptional regulator